MKTKGPYVIICIAILVAVFVCGARKQGAALNGKWEYNVVSHMKIAGMKSVDEILTKGFQATSLKDSEFINAEMSDRMNRLGDQGWELVCYSKETGFVFKRLR